MKGPMSESDGAIKAVPLRALGLEIIESIDLPVLVIGCDSKISGFNQAAATLFSLRPSDVGRLAREIRILSSIKRFEDLCADVIGGGPASQGEVRDTNGCWFVLRIAAYRGSDQQINGAVLTLTNVTAVRESLEQAVHDREYTKAILNTVIDPLVVLDEDLQIQTANQAFYTMLQVSREETRGGRLPELGSTDWVIALETLLKNSRSTDLPATAIEVEHEFPTIGHRKVLLNARPISGKGNFKPLILLSIHDITERKRAEERLRENEHRFRQMIEALPAAVYTTDAEGRLTHFNQAAVEFSGRVPDLSTDKWCVSWKLYRPDGTPLPHDECPMAIALKDGATISGVEVIAERPDGTRVWFTPYPTPFRDGDGRIVGGINMLVDITERKKAEEVTARLAAIVEYSDDAIISKDLNGVIATWNESAERLFGYTAQEAIGQPVTMLIPSERLDEEPGILERIRKGESIEHYETIRRRKDGKLLDISLSVSPIADRAGRVVGASNISRDITARKQIDQALRASEERYRNLFRSIDEGFCIVEVVFDENKKPVDYIFLEINPAFERQTGIQNAHGRSMREIAPQHEEHWFQLYGQIVLTGESKRFEYPAVQLQRWYEGYAYRIGEANVKKVGIIFNDITERKKAQEVLERTVTERTAKLRATVEELESYSYSIAHDMRAPLRAMQGFSDILIKEYAAKIDTDGQRYLRRIALSADRMDHLIEDVLNYSKVVRAELPLESIAIDTLLQGMLETYPVFFPDEADIQVQTPMPRVVGNEAALTQVFSNLLGNAIKFVTPGLKPMIRVWAEEVNVSCASTSSHDGMSGNGEGRGIRFLVQDNGIGIAPDQHEKIFEIFQRINKNTPGTGIGLAIVKKAAERMGGRVGVQSFPGKGSTFWLELRTP